MNPYRRTSVARVAVLLLLGLLASPLLAGEPAAAAPAVRADAAPAPAGDAEIAVYAAASLRDVLGELTPGLEKAAGAKLVFNFAGSNDLARQILAADKADLFISADEGWTDKVADAGLVDKDSRRALLSNRLVVIAPKDSALKIASAEDLVKAPLSKIAMADPEAVPAGKYAKAWLEKTGQWTDALRSRVLSTADVRAALAAVTSGNVEAGIVYKTDAAISPKVRIVYEVPEADTPKISYPIAVMAHSPHIAEARKAAEWLAGPDARRTFEKFGFITLGSGGTPRAK